MKSLLLPVTLSLIVGCATAPPPVHSMKSADANFTAFNTFAWGKSKDADASAPLTILDSNIRAAIAGEFQRKGYTEAAVGTNPDLLLQYETAAAEKTKSNPFRIGIGMGGAGSNGAAGVGVSSASEKNVREGTLVLRVIDPVRNAEVWNGRVSRELSHGGPPDPELIRSAVGELL